MGKDFLDEKKIHDLARTGERVASKVVHELEYTVNQATSEREADNVSREAERDVKKAAHITMKTSEKVIDSAECGYKWGEKAWERIKNRMNDITL